MLRYFLLLAFSITASAQDSALLYERTLGGRGSDNIAAIVVEPSGNLLVAGTTGSFDFPVTDGSTNHGTSISLSEDHGRTWRPLANIPGGATSIVADASDPPVLFAGGSQGVFRSTDLGHTWQVSLPPEDFDCSEVPLTNCATGSLAAHPTKPGVIYATVTTGFFKTVDGGETWQRADNGIAMPGRNVGFEADYLVFDPFDPDTIYTFVFAHFYRTTNGGASWDEFTSPTSAFGNVGARRRRVAFDPFAQGTIFLAGAGGVFRSMDHGATWEHLTAPFDAAFAIDADPFVEGTFYVGTTQNTLYRTTDRGATWDLMLDPGSGDILVDPFAPDVILSGGSRSEDHGATWSALGLGRGASGIAFDPHTAGRLWAAAEDTTDGFLARLDPSGQEILFATYFGGPGNETIQQLALDGAGNIYVMGRADATGFPVTPGAAFPTAVADGTPEFLAKLDPQGKVIYATYAPNVPLAIAASPDGGLVLGGFYCEVVKLAPDGNLAFRKQLGRDGDICQGLAVDPQGNIAVGGHAGFNSTFPSTPDALQPGRSNSVDGALALLDPQGNVIYATFLGGSAPTAPANMDGKGETRIDQVAFDADGNLVVTGRTATADFPVTPGAYQSALRANCSYPSSSVYTGFIGTITTYRMDDVFLTRIDRSGTRVLSSTLLGGDCYEYPVGLAVDGDGNAWITGQTDSNPFPQVSSFHAGPDPQTYSGFIARIGSKADLLLSSYVPGGGATAVATARDGTSWIGGSTAQGASVNSGGPFPPPIPPPTDAYLAHVGTPAAGGLHVTGVGSIFTQQSGPISAGELVRVYLDGFDPGETTNLGWTPSDPLPRALAGIEVRFDGEPAALYAAGPGYVEGIAPYALKGKSGTVIQATRDGVASTALHADVRPATLVLYSMDGTGTGQAVARNEDQTLNSPANPAAPGSLITFFFTGGGVADPACPEGGKATSWDSPVPGGMTADVHALPGFLCGLFQVQVQIPEDTAAQPGRLFSLPQYDAVTQQQISRSPDVTFAVGP